MGACRLGNLIKFVPHPVTTGFTTGIAVVIATLQVKDLFGLRIDHMPERYTEKIETLWQAHGSASAEEFLIAAATLAMLVGLPRLSKRLPSHLVALGTVSIVAASAHRFFPWIDVATIGSRFHSVVDGVERAGIPSVMPTPAFPWRHEFSLSMIHDLAPAAFAIAMLGAIESLLSAVIADGMTSTKHDPNAELVALGIGNIIAPIFGGIAATGALARTATNIRAGAKSPIAAVTHAIVVLLGMLVIAPLIAFIPMASLAALLLLVAWNMADLPHFVGLVRIAPRSDVLVLLTCFFLTVFVDMVFAISIGFMLAAILFMRRMADFTQATLTLDNTEESRQLDLPSGVILYEVNGPLFFGAAQRAMEALHTTRTDSFTVLILSLGKVSVIDATGFAALENAIADLAGRKKTVILAGPLPEPASIFAKAQLEAKHLGWLRVASDLSAAVSLARTLVPSAILVDTTERAHTVGST
jgi:SulP family sulfate permease